MCLESSSHLPRLHCFLEKCFPLIYKCVTLIILPSSLNHVFSDLSDTALLLNAHFLFRFLHLVYRP